MRFCASGIFFNATSFYIYLVANVTLFLFHRLVLIYVYILLTVILLGGCLAVWTRSGFEAALHD
jgi:hypothetical protein